MDRQFCKRRNTQQGLVCKKEDYSDRISQLPHEIIKHIVSFLPVKDAVATGILSKTWQGIPPTVQHFNFNEGSFPLKWDEDREISAKFSKYINELDEDREISAKFSDFIDESLQRLYKCEENIRMFSLYMESYFEEYGHRILKWIKFTADNDFHVLCMSFRIHPARFSMPQTTFGSKLLNVLRLDSCDLNDDCISHTTELVHLQELTLHMVHLSEGVLNRLISISPSITNFSLKLCTGVKFLQLRKLTRLKKVVVKEGYRNDGSDWIHGIKIKAMSLRSFDFESRSDQACKIDLHCRNLETLCLNALFLPRLFSRKLFSRFPLLKSLFLLGRHKLERVEISSPLLEHLNLCFLDNVVDATIDTPNLLSFKHSGYGSELFLVEMNAMHLQKAKLMFKANYYPRLDVLYNTSWFLNLRKFIAEKLRHNEVLSLVIQASPIEFRPKKLKEIPIPPLCHVNHLKLNLRYDISRMCLNPLINGILWSCHPETLIMKFDHECNSKFIEALLKELKSRKKNPKKCCKHTHMKCWRHELKDVDIEQFTEAKTRKHRALCQKISFRFTW